MALIQTGTGFSTLKDSYHAGREATETALLNVKNRPQVLLVFAASCFDHDALLAGIQSITGDIPMTGGSTAGEISSRGFTSNSVVILAMASDTLRFSTAHAKGIRDKSYECASEFVRTMFTASPFESPIALMAFPDGQTQNGVAVIDGLQSQSDENVDLVGGFLGNDDRLGPTVQYHNGTVLKNAITGLLIHASEPLTTIKTGSGCCSGFTSIGNSMTCTSASGNVLEEIDHGPALDFYMEVLGEKRSARLPEVCLEYPFGLADPGTSGSNPSWMQIRSGISVDYERRTITMAGPISKGSLMTLATCSRADLINAARLAAEEARAKLDGCLVELVMVFSCVGRKNVLGRRANEEVEAVKEVFGEGVPIIGLYTHGEIGPVTIAGQEEQNTLFHNETIVVWGLGSERS